MKLYLLSVTEIEHDFPSHMEKPDLFFPVAQADITECSTYAVVCRLKASPTFTITSKGGSFSHPDHPGVTVTIPENAVAPNEKFSLMLKVGMSHSCCCCCFFYHNWLVIYEENINICLPNICKSGADLLSFTGGNNLKEQSHFFICFVSFVKIFASNLCK